MSESKRSRILLVDDEEGIREVLCRLLIKEGYQVDIASGQVDAIACIKTVHYDLAFIDIILMDGESGIDLLRSIKIKSPATQVIMITGYPQVKTAAEAVRHGAFDYIAKPIQRELLVSISRKALTVKKLHEDKELYRANLDAIFRGVTDPIIMVDREGCLAQFNPSAEIICGYTDDMIGRNVATIDLSCGHLFHLSILETLHTLVPKEMRRVECQTPDGKNLIISFRTTPVTDTHGTVIGAMTVVRDKTRLLELEQSLQQRQSFKGIIGMSVPMQRVYVLIEALANVTTTVLIDGESGTGKELVAAALHYSGGRAKGPFVKVNCSALSESLLESELFGHVRGAFTGAIADKIGRFQKADGGTLFLDEIGDISPTVQMRLLRVLQESEFERVGDTIPIKVDVRIVAATNKDLAAMVVDGTFRQDLYYRLNVVRLGVPALRERTGDFALLIKHFVTKFNKKLTKDIQGVSADTMTVFNNHTWPGNVRQLEHAIEYASIMCKSDLICRQDLPQDLLENVDFVTEDPLFVSPKKNLTFDEALASAGGNKTRMAKLMGISRRTLYRRLAERCKPKL